MRRSFRLTKSLTWMALILVGIATRTPDRILVGVLGALTVMVAISLLGATGIAARLAPLLFRTPVPAHVKVEVAYLAGCAGIADPIVIVLRHQHRNGFAVGFIGPVPGIVGLTSGLVHSDDDDELRGTIAHEIAHLARHDTVRVWLEWVGYAACASLVWYLAPWWLALPASGAGYFGVLAIWRRHELGADCMAAELTGDACVLEGLVHDEPWLLERLLATHPTRARREAAVLVHLKRYRAELAQARPDIEP